MSKVFSTKQLFVSIFTFLTCRPGLFKFNQHLYNLSLRSIGILNAHGEKLSGEEWLLKQLSRQSQTPSSQLNQSRSFTCQLPLLSPIPTIVDVGANTKIYGIDYFPKAEFWAFEPHPQTFQLLKANSPQSKRIQLIQKAVSNRSGTTKLYDFADDAKLKSTQPTSTLASLSQSIILDLHGQKTKSFQVKTTTLDLFAKQKVINHIDLLKIDVEGFELEVLKGARNLIKHNKIDLIQFEFNQHHSYRRVFFKDFLDQLPNHQFFRLSPHGLLPLNNYRPQSHEIFAFQNILAVRRAILN